jgi:hypothetical protein
MGSRLSISLCRLSIVATARQSPRAACNKL